MPDANRRPNQHFIAAALFFSAAVMFALAAVLYAGVIDLGEEVRLTAAVAVGIAAFADLIVAILFFRRGQSS